MWDAFDLLLLVIHVCQMACNSGMAGRRAKQSEIWDSKVMCMSDTFDLRVFNVILGSFGALVSTWPVTRRQLSVERNGVKFGIQGSYVYMGYICTF